MLLTALFATLLSVHADAAKLLRYYPSAVMRNEVVEFKSASGHHFSLEAPQRCGSGSLQEKTPRVVRCQFLAPGKTKAALNVCDDNNTACRPVEAEVTVLNAVLAGASEELVRNEHINRNLKTKLVADFNEGSVAQLSINAQASEKPVLLLVSTDWCPPCNEAKEYMLAAPEVKAALDGWFKIDVDGDNLLAAEWDKIVPFRYFPTFVALNSQMQEIGRYNGEIRRADFVKWLSQQKARMDDPIVKLEARVEARLEGRWRQKLNDLIHAVSSAAKIADFERMLDYAMDREQYELAEKIIAQGSYPRLAIEILHFQIDQLERREQKANVERKSEKVALYQKILDLSFHGDHWSESLSGLCELDAAACKVWLVKIPERVAFLEGDASLAGAEKDSRLGDEYYYVSEVYQALEDKAGLKEFSRRCSEHFSAMRQTSLLSISRAAQQGLVACLELGQDFGKEEAALKTLIAAYPQEPTFLWRMARMLRKRKKSERALEWVGKAEKLAYGYNWYSLQLLKADLDLDLKRADAAEQVVTKTLAEIRLDGIPESRNQSLVARLRAVQAKAMELSSN